jgi:hypothetical protein
MNNKTFIKKIFTNKKNNFEKINENLLENINNDNIDTNIDTNIEKHSNKLVFIDYTSDLSLKRPSISPQKYRSLLFREVHNNDEDKELLFEAAKNGDFEVIKYCYKHGLACDLNCILVAVKNNNFTVITAIGQQNNNLFIDADTCNYLIANKNKTMLNHLLQNNMLSKNIIGQLINLL